MSRTRSASFRASASASSRDAPFCRARAQAMTMSPMPPETLRESTFAKRPGIECDAVAIVACVPDRVASTVITSTSFAYLSAASYASRMSPSDG